MPDKPFAQSFWVHDYLCAGHYPGDLDPARRDRKLQGLLDCGILRILNLMEPDETGRGNRPFEPYEQLLQDLAAKRGIRIDLLRISIPDAATPTPDIMRRILDTLDESFAKRLPTYLHCWGGHGRTSTVVACHLIQRGHSPEQAIELIRKWRQPLTRNHEPYEGRQKAFVLSWVVNKEEQK